MNLYAASVALLWSTALRLPPLPQVAARDGAPRQPHRAGVRCDRGLPMRGRAGGGRRARE